MTILVTGSSGHLGEALVRSLRVSGEPVRGVDIQASDFTTHEGSVADPVLVKDCMRGVKTVYHTATLHKPHIATHSKQAFVETNISGTLALLEAALGEGVKTFVFTSTTSVFGHAMRPGQSNQAVWVDENLPPVPKNIYGITKSAAENLCQLFHQRHGMGCVVLRTSRFFPEEDDDPAMREQFDDQNIKANEMLYRRVDVEDVVSAHLLAARRAAAIGFGRYIISATSPFKPADLPELMNNAPAVVERYFPGCSKLYAQAGWRMFERISRVYSNVAARADLGWKPRYDFAHVLNCLAHGMDFRSALTLQTGRKGYHDQVFQDGPYPIEG